jgi:hypothetical protein
MGGALETAHRGLSWENYGRGFAENAPVGLTYGMGFGLTRVVPPGFWSGVLVDASASGAGGMTEQALRGGDAGDILRGGGTGLLVGGGMGGLGRAIAPTSVIGRVGLGAGGGAGLAWLSGSDSDAIFQQGVMGGAFALGGAFGERGQRPGVSSFGSSRFGRWLQTRSAAGLMRAQIGLANVPGLSGQSYTPDIPSRPSAALIVDSAGRPVSSQPSTTSPVVAEPIQVPSPASAPPSSNWQTVSPGSTPYAPYNLPVVVQLRDPVDEAFSEHAQFQGGSLHMIGRTQASGRSRDFGSLDVIQLNPDQRAAATRIHGQIMPVALQQAWQLTSNPREQADAAEIQRLWNVGQHDDARELARAAFDRHRTRFWRFVRRNPALRQFFTDAGMVFPGGPASAPVYFDPVTGQRLDFMSLEHQQRLHDNPTRAIDQTNLQLVLGDENSVYLENIRRFDPHQNP